jgi:hypothetical protein
VCLYENIGIDYFKVSGRRMSTKWLLNTSRAYSARRWDGNLAEILNFIVPGVDPDMHSGQYQTYVMRPEFVEKEKLIKIGQAHPVKPYIDNRKLDGFVDHFRKVDCVSSCGSCTYCAEWAKNVVRWPEDRVAKYVEALRALHEDLVTSEAFREGSEDDSRGAEDSSMSWGTEVRQQFHEVIRAVPEEFQEIARFSTERRSVENARARGAAIVEEGDMVLAFLSETPAAFRSDMLSKLNAMGILVEKYNK